MSLALRGSTCGVALVAANEVRALRHEARSVSGASDGALAHRIDFLLLELHLVFELLNIGTLLTTGLPLREERLRNGEVVDEG